MLLGVVGGKARVKGKAEVKGQGIGGRFHRAKVRSESRDGEAWCMGWQGPAGDLTAAWAEASGMPIPELVQSWTSKMGFPVLRVLTDPFENGGALEVEQQWFLAGPRPPRRRPSSRSEEGS